MSYLIEEELHENTSVISSLDPKQIEAISAAMIKAIKNGNKVIFFGNGGSASDAVHIAAEFSGRYLMGKTCHGRHCSFFLVINNGNRK